MKANNKEIISCPLCNHNKYKILQKAYQGYEQAVICKKCSLVYLNPRHNPDWYIKYYESKDRKKEINVKRSDMENYAQKQINKGRSIHRYLKSELSDFSLNKMSVLELGCTAGGILSYFKDKGVRTVEGIDLEKDYIDFGKKYFKINLINTSIDQYKTEKKFDLIIMRHVLEHLANPIESLLKIKKLLSKDGIIFIEVPSLFSMGIKQYLFANFIHEHPIVYSPSTLSMTVRKVGLRQISKNKNNNRTHMRIIIKNEAIRTKDVKFDNYFLTYLKCKIYNKTTPIRKLYYQLTQS